MVWNHLRLGFPERRVAAQALRYSSKNPFSLDRHLAIYRDMQRRQKPSNRNSASLSYGIRKAAAARRGIPSLDGPLARATSRASTFHGGKAAGRGDSQSLARSPVRWSLPAMPCARSGRPGTHLYLSTPAQACRHLPCRASQHIAGRHPSTAKCSRDAEAPLLCR